MKTKKEVELLIPKDKFDNTNIEELIALTNKEIESIIPDLLIWFTDMNLNVTKELVAVLSTREEILRKQLNDILSNLEEDPIFKYNIINHILASFSVEDLKNYEKSLKRIVEKPTVKEVHYETPVVANKIYSLIK
ncbi:MAG TPA: DUF5071 domain-containing protein [Haploplasma sp.]|nr:DUF5071 domain-containing protein [Haploplasma sp.]